MKLLFTISFAVITVCGYSQKVFEKAYAFSRESVSGKREVIAKPGSKPIIKEAKPVITWYFFIEGNFDTSGLSIRSVWINKKRYFINQFSLINTPYTIKGSEDSVGEITELVPATGKTVIQVWNGKKSVQQNKPASFARRLSKNEVVFVIDYQKKTYYLEVKKIKILPPQSDL